MSIASSPRDDAAFSALYERWRAPVYAFLRKMIYSSTEAEDLTEETFLHAWRAFGGFNGVSPGHWLMRIAAHVRVDWLRHTRPYLVQNFDPHGRYLPVLDGLLLRRNGSPAEEHDRLEAAQWVDSLTQCLSPSYRQIVFMMLAGYSNEEIACRAGISNGNVRISKVRAYRLLRAQLAAEA